MGYRGYTEQLCSAGHYSAQDCYFDDPKACPHCGAPIAFAHGVDQTNGYSRRYSYSCEAKKAEIGFDDVWHEDHYGTRYATKLIRYEPRGRAWRKVASDRDEHRNGEDAKRLSAKPCQPGPKASPEPFSHSPTPRMEIG